MFVKCFLFRPLSHGSLIRTALIIIFVLKANHKNLSLDKIPKSLQMIKFIVKNNLKKKILQTISSRILHAENFRTKKYSPNNGNDIFCKKFYKIGLRKFFFLKNVFVNFYENIKSYFAPKETIRI